MCPNMGLSSGSKLGLYEIETPIAAGGMGEVYRARDTRLDRTVAVKILPSHLCENPEARQRFEREARTISSLNHPNICTLHDVGSQDGTDFLVMEHLEGETLADRLHKGGLPLAEALAIAIAVADALDKAHSHGIVHRDLKPANIMLTKNGPKLMDFGLAKPATTLGGSGAAGPLTPSTPTMSLASLSAPASPLTQKGTIVGTFQYMAPEVLQGAEADPRSDIFSFGCMLYEMITGRRAFEGKSQFSVLGAILDKEPERIGVLQPTSPQRLGEVVHGCLAKDRDQRFGCMHDVELHLRAIAEGGSQSGVPAPVAGARKNRERVLAGVALAGILAAIVLGTLYWGRTPEKPRVVRSDIKAMPNAPFFLTGQQASGFAISPDGLRLAYVARSAEGKSVLWIRSLDSLQAQPLAGTEDAGFPFWSPDSRFIGFFAEGKLKKIEVSGGPPLTLCDAPTARGGTWNQDGVILFAPSVNTPLHRVSAAGGTPIPVTTLDLSKGATTHRWPFFLPDGKHFLYDTGTPIAARENSPNAIMLGSLESRESKLLLHTHAGALYASGHILFLRQNTLMAQPFDIKRMELSGDAFPIADAVQEEETSLHSLFSVSRNGVLAYLEGSSIANRDLVWIDRSGKKVADVPGSDSYSYARIAPDGKSLAYVTHEPIYDIWTYDIPRGVKTRLTFGAAAGQANLTPVWFPDGQRIAYLSLRNGKYGIYQKSADGSGSEELLIEGTDPKYPNDWSPDSKFLLFQQASQGRNAVWVLPLGGERKPYPFRESQATSFASAFSPDGKWLAYCSSATGEQQVYVEPFPGPGGRWQASPAGGCFPRWRRDQQELFYLSTDNKMMAAEVKASGLSVAVGAVIPLFETQLYRTVTGAFDVTADGQRFLLISNPGQPNASITLVENWDAELKK